jgi:hypothetical protein
MSFQWHGRENSELVWEQEIVRYYFISNESVVTRHAHGYSEIIKVGTRLKLTKSEARKFFKDGYIEFRTTNWNSATARYDRVTIQLHKGFIGKDVETRQLKQSECLPEDVALPKRKQKK